MDCYKPAEIAANVKDAGISKTSMPVERAFMLALLAGAFISFGALF